MVGPTGNAPMSPAYRADALLLSYGPVRMEESGELASQPAGPVRSLSRRRPGFPGSLSRGNWRREVSSHHNRLQPVQRVSNTCRASPGSPSEIGRQRSRTPATRVARPVSNGCPRLADLSSESLRGWNCTTVSPFRRRLPDLLAPRGGNWRAWRGTWPRRLAALGAAHSAFGGPISAALRRSALCW